MSLPNYERYVDDWYWNYGQNRILNSAFQAIEKQKKFTSRAIKDFISIFIK